MTTAKEPRQEGGFEPTKRGVSPHDSVEEPTQVSQNDNYFEEGFVSYLVLN